MRLTNNLITSKYLKCLNSNLSDLSDITEKVSAERSYLKASEDPATAMKAFQVRKSLTRLSQYSDNIEEVDGVSTEMESSVKELNEIVQEALSKVQQGKSGTYSATDRASLAKTLTSYQEQILSIANSKYSDEYIFGGSTTDEVPFTLDSSGNLLYKGTNVETGTFTEEYRYVDVGMGMTVDSSGTVDPQSAYNLAYSGTTLLGSGTDSSGITNNVYNLIGDIADMFTNNDMTDIDTYYSKLSDMADDIVVQYAAIGEKASFAEYLSNRITTQTTNLTTKQTALESLGTAEGAILYNEQEVAYNACLQIGDDILQNTLLDYID